MDIEQLKLVLEMLQSVSHDASSLVILWLWLKFGSGVLNVVGVLLGVLGVVGIIAYIVRVNEGDAQAQRFLRNMRDTLGIGSSGYLTDDERERTQDVLRQMALDRRAQKTSK